MSIILDTNVLLSGLLIGEGPPAKLLDAWERSRFQLVCCHELIAEFREVAARPFFRAKGRASAVELLAAGLRDFSLYCEHLPRVPVAPDPKDTFLLALAEASAADFLVTGDKALQAMKRYKSTRIISPSAMMALLREQEKRQQE